MQVKATDYTTTAQPFSTHTKWQTNKTAQPFSTHTKWQTNKTAQPTTKRACSVCPRRKQGNSTRLLWSKCNTSHVVVGTLWSIIIIPNTEHHSFSSDTMQLRGPLLSSTNFNLPPGHPLPPITSFHMTGVES